MCNASEGCDPESINLPMTPFKQSVLETVGNWLGLLVCILQILLITSTKVLGLFIDMKIDR
jgi:hypothetical protein